MRRFFMPVILTKHYIDRFFERQAKTKRISYFTEMAFISGKDVTETKYGQFAKQLEYKEGIYNSIAKIYNGFIYWFVDNRAITIYPLPNKYRARA
jgi:hypothetical protein